MRSRGAVLAGARLASCMALATVGASLLHGSQSYSYWLPLTVAVAVRPEYASAFGRTVNRVAGTLAGAFAAMMALRCVDSGWRRLPHRARDPAPDRPAWSATGRRRIRAMLAEG